jgi:hypothetical protein
VAFFDIKKAYDRVCRRITINFLENRNFRVLNNGQLPSRLCQENGVPQGSLMSVSCFLVAINGLEKFVLDRMNLEFPGMDIIFLT